MTLNQKDEDLFTKRTLILSTQLAHLSRHPSSKEHHHGKFGALQDAILLGNLFPIWEGMVSFKAKRDR